MGARMTSIRRLVFLVCLSVGAIASTPVVASNLVVNGGFESGLAGWIVDAPDGGGLTSAEAQSGLSSFAAFGSESLYQSFSAVPVTAISEFSFWVKRSGGIFNFVGFQYSDGSSLYTLPTDWSADNVWTKVDVTSSMDPTKSLIGFQVYGTSPGPAYLDNFQLIASVPEPEIFAMLMAGLGLLGFMARRKKLG